MKLVVIEIGAGVAVPTVRYASQSFCTKFNAKLIRVNPEHPEVRTLEYHSLSFTDGAIEFIEQVNKILSATQ